MKKMLGLITLTLGVSTAFAQELPSKEEMEAVHTCAINAGIELPAPGEGKPPKLTKEQKAIVDDCFEKNGVEPPPHPKEMEAVRTCVTNAGIEMPNPGEGKPPKLTQEQKQIVDNCLEKNGIEPPPHGMK